MVEYQVEDELPPFTIVLDQHMLFYMKFKKRELDFNKYLLCLTCEKNYRLSSFFNSSEMTLDGSIVVK